MVLKILATLMGVVLLVSCSSQSDISTPQENKSLIQAGSKTGLGVQSGLPFSKGKDFQTLDEYLAHRKQLGRIDLPWYRSVGNDQFVLVARIKKQNAQQTFTRADLLKKYGFKD